jgi:hypothetical protein
MDDLGPRLKGVCRHGDRTDYLSLVMGFIFGGRKDEARDLIRSEHVDFNQRLPQPHG